MPYMDSVKTTSNKKYFYGKYRGVVEYNMDPLRVGRCKIRVPDIHGPHSEDMIPLLPWARPIMITPCNPDEGSFIVPSINTWVWVEFEGGNKDCPLYQGGYPAIGEVPVESSENMQSGTTPTGKSAEIPTAWTLYKSSKGATIGGQESDGKESLWIIDQVGQIFKTVSSLKSGIKRGKKTALTTDSLQYEDLPSKKSVAIFKSFGGGFIQFISEYLKEKISLVSTNREKTRNSGISLNSSVGKVSTILLAEDKEAGNTVYLKADATLGQIDIRVIKDGKDASLINLGDYVTISPELRCNLIQATTVISSPSEVDPPSSGMDPEITVDSQDESI